MIRLENVSKNFQNHKAVDNVSLTIEEGQTLVLLGTSGSGKTTTLRMINRLTEPSRGTIFLDGHDILDLRAEDLRRRIGYVLQNYGLFPHYTVAENIAIVPRLLKWKAPKIAGRTEELLIKLQLPPEEFAAKYPSELSGGQMQRVGLARALAADPPVLLMDEPFGALDTLTRMSVRREFTELDELKKKTIILVTHDIHEAFELGNRVALMDHGRIQQSGSPAELLFKPANNFVKGFLKENLLQLELQAIRFDKIWNLLPSVEGERSAGVQSSLSLSLWKAVNLLAERPQPLTVINAKTGEVKNVSTADIFKALHMYKSLI